MSDTQTPIQQAPAAPEAAEKQSAKTEAPKSDAPVESKASSGSGGAKTAMAEAVDEVLKNTKSGSESEKDVSDDEIDETVDESDLSAKEKKEAKKLWKLKVSGKDLDVDEAELVRRAQMGFSADQKWQEAAQLRKQVEGFIQKLQQNPTAALADLGFDVDTIAEKHIQQRIEEMQKSPEQLEREKLQKEVERLKKERMDLDEQKRQAEMSRLQEQFAVEIENDIMGALSDPSNSLPKSPYFIKRIADTMIFAMQNGYKNITAKDALNIIKDEVRGELRDMYTAAPDDIFEELVGKDRLNKYRKSKITKSKKSTESLPSNKVQATGKTELSAKEPAVSPKKMRAKDFFKNLGSK